MIPTKMMAASLAFLVYCENVEGGLNSTFTRIVDSTMVAPGSMSRFSYFNPPSLDCGNVVFSAAKEGIPGAWLYGYFDGILIRIADEITVLPNGGGPMQSINYSPTIAGQLVGFWASSAGGNQRGVYTYSNGAFQVIADRNTLIPSTPRTFYDFGPPSMTKDAIAFVGEDRPTMGPNDFGIYSFTSLGLQVHVNGQTPVPGGGSFFGLLSNSLPYLDGQRIVFHGGPSADGIYLFDGSAVQLIANYSTPVPGFSGYFNSFSSQSAVLSGDTVVFWGGSGAYEGLFATYPAFRRVADLNEYVPDGLGRFTRFPRQNFSIDGDMIAFLGEGYIGQKGIYAEIAGSLHKVIDLDDLLDGQPLSFIGLGMGREAASGNQIAFSAQFATGTSAIYLATINCIAGDLNNDLTISIDDLDLFSTIVLAPAAADSGEFCSADLNSDGCVNGLDVQGFIEAVTKQ